MDWLTRGLDSVTRQKCQRSILSPLNTFICRSTKCLSVWSLEGSATARLGIPDFQIHWIFHVDFRFQIGFLYFMWISGFLNFKTNAESKLAKRCTDRACIWHINICMNKYAWHIAHVNLENDLCTRPKIGWVQRSLLCTDVIAITSYKIRGRPCKSSDVISLKYTDIRGVSWIIFRLDFRISEWISADSVRGFFRGGPLVVTWFQILLGFAWRLFSTSLTSWHSFFICVFWFSREN